MTIVLLRNNSERSEFYLLRISTVCFLWHVMFKSGFFNRQKGGSHCFMSVLCSNVYIISVDINKKTLPSFGRCLVQNIGKLHISKGFVKFWHSF